jgi:hypothetical protein
MVSIEDALTYPTESDDWIVTVLIGGIMSILSFLIIPAFIVYGYLVRAIQANLEGEPEPPTFGDWGDLIVDGIKVMVVTLVYMIIPMIVFAVTVGTAILAILTGTEGGAAAGAGTIIVGSLATLVLALVFGYFAVVGIVNFAKEDSFGAAFDVETIKSVGLDGEFAVPWLISVGVFVGISVVVGVLNVIPGLGALLGAFLNFYGLIVASTLWADGFVAATDGGDSGGQAQVEETPV